MDSMIKEEGFQIGYALDALKDPKLFVMIIMYIGCSCSAYAISFFLPSIIEGLGYTAAQ
jgi:hypothetical protein